MNTKRYSESQVFCGLQEAWPTMIGVDDPFDADISVVDFMKDTGVFDEIDLLDVFHDLEEFFGFSCHRNEWLRFFELEFAKRDYVEWERQAAPRLTFGALAKFISERAVKRAAFNPITVFGRNCAPAGVFTGMQSVAAQVTGKQLRFAPSAWIFEVLQGRNLDDFWMQVRWMTERKIPGLPEFWRGVPMATGWLSGIAVGISLLFVWEADNPIRLMSVIFFVAVLCFLFALAYKHFVNPLPSSIVTFRDLSILIARDSTATQTDSPRL